MPQRKTRLKPSKKAAKDPEKFIRRAKAWQAKFRAEGRCFEDSTVLIRAERESHS